MKLFLQHFLALVALTSLFSGAAHATSHSADSGNITVDTRTLVIDHVEVTGPATVQGGQTGSYAARIFYTGGVNEDVTSRCVWSALTDVSVAEMAGGGPTLAAQARSTTTAITVVARFSTGTQTRSGNKSVTLTPGFGLGLGNVTVGNGSGTRTAGSWTISAVAVPKGGAPPVTYDWSQTPGGTIGTSGATPAMSATLTGASGTRVLTVSARDAQGRTASATTRVVLPVPAAPLEPPTIPPGRLTGGKMLMPDGVTPFSYATPARSGLIIIAHGLKDGVGLIDSDGVPSIWQQTMAANIAARLQAEGKPPVDIALLDWHDGANPVKVCTSYEQCALFANTTDLAWWQGSLGLGGAVLDLTTNVLAGATDVVTDFVLIKPNGLLQGQWLADWLRTEVAAGRLTQAETVQIIGHSAGGFVAGEAGYNLARKDLDYVDQVTMLDTPFPKRNHFTVYAESPSPGKVERYVSSLFGQLAPTLEFRYLSPILPGNVVELLILRALTVYPDEQYHLRNVPDGPFALWLRKRHSWGWGWYTGTAAAGSTEQDGFYYSPFMGHTWSASGQAAAAAQARSPRDNGGPTAQHTPLTGWTTFGSVTSDATGYTIAESDTNAGLTKTLTLPADTDSLVFDAKFTQAGDGDYLAVSWGRSYALYALADLPLTRDGFSRCEVELNSHAGETNDIIIKLETAGNTNAIARVENLGLCTDTDIDRDGLTTTQEASAGTNPQQYDTDGDGLSDSEELQTLLTNPTLADTDGDGISDGVELSSGTDPKNGTSVFAITSVVTQANGNIGLTWSSVPGKTYRLVRASDLSGYNTDVVTESIQAIGNSTTTTDARPPSDRAFYWVELLQ